MPTANVLEIRDSQWTKLFQTYPNLRVLVSTVPASADFDLTTANVLLLSNVIHPGRGICKVIQLDLYAKKGPESNRRIFIRLLAKYPTHGSVFDVESEGSGNGKWNLVEINFDTTPGSVRSALGVPLSAAITLAREYTIHHLNLQVTNWFLKNMDSAQFVVQRVEALQSCVGLTNMDTQVFFQIVDCLQFMRTFQFPVMRQFDWVVERINLQPESVKNKFGHKQIFDLMALVLLQPFFWTGGTQPDRDFRRCPKKRDPENCMFGGFSGVDCTDGKLPDKWYYHFYNYGLNENGLSSAEIEREVEMAGTRIYQEQRPELVTVVQNDFDRNKEKKQRTPTLQKHHAEILLQEIYEDFMSPTTAVGHASEVVDQCLFWSNFLSDPSTMLAVHQYWATYCWKNCLWRDDESSVERLLSANLDIGSSSDSDDDTEATGSDQETDQESDTHSGQSDQETDTLSGQSDQESDEESDGEQESDSGGSGSDGASNVDSDVESDESSPAPPPAVPSPAAPLTGEPRSRRRPHGWYYNKAMVAATSLPLADAAGARAVGLPPLPASGQHATIFICLFVMVGICVFAICKHRGSSVHTISAMEVWPRRLFTVLTVCPAFVLYSSVLYSHSRESLPVINLVLCALVTAGAVYWVRHNRTGHGELVSTDSVLPPPAKSLSCEEVVGNTSASENICVLFKSPATGETERIYVKSCARLGHVKRLITSMDGTAPGEQKLSFNGKILEECRTLFDYNIVRTVTLQIKHSMVGGMQKISSNNFVKQFAKRIEIGQGEKGAARTSVIDGTAGFRRDDYVAMLRDPFRNLYFFGELKHVFNMYADVGPPTVFDVGCGEFPIWGLASVLLGAKLVVFCDTPAHIEKAFNYLRDKVHGPNKFKFYLRPRHSDCIYGTAADGNGRELYFLSGDAKETLCAEEVVHTLAEKGRGQPAVVVSETVDDTPSGEGHLEIMDKASQAVRAIFPGHPLNLIPAEVSQTLEWRVFPKQLTITTLKIC